MRIGSGPHDDLEIPDRSGIGAVHPAVGQQVAIERVAGHRGDVVVGQDGPVEQTTGAVQDLLVQRVGQRVGQVHPERRVHPHEAGAVLPGVEERSLQPARGKHVRREAARRLGLHRVLDRDPDIGVFCQHREDGLPDPDSRHVDPEERCAAHREDARDDLGLLLRDVRRRRRHGAGFELVIAQQHQRYLVVAESEVGL